MRRRRPVRGAAAGSPWSATTPTSRPWPPRPPAADRVAEGAAVADLLARLDPDRREAFVLTQLLGLPYAEAAEVAGCPVGTIRSRVARARARPDRRPSAE